MKHLLTAFSIALILLSAGCSGLGRPALDAAGGAAGAGLGYSLSDGNPWATIGGAAGGVLVSEGAQGLYRKGQDRSYQNGYRKGQSDAVKALYWDLQYQQRFPRNQQ